MIDTQAPSTNTVGDWLAVLDKTEKDAFLHYVKNSTSDIESYLYARFLRPAYSGSIADLTAWVQEKLDITKAKAAWLRRWSHGSRYKSDLLE